MACSFWLAVDMSKLPDSAGLPDAERAADLYVESRRSMTPAEILSPLGVRPAREAGATTPSSAKPGR